MVRFLIGTLGVMALLLAGPAQARECVTGWITQIDLQNDTITLDSGVILAVSGDINLESLSDGVRVKVVIEPTNHGPKAVSVAPASSPPRGGQSAGRV